ncbi:hypothetical protein [Anabaena azotica]|uniref:Nif11-type n=1 Tax=Anabaena azotica FACHB-119 TaxID=947527 RepID=A0ABR8DDX5_9NOST|nr:hypothetical protein [Anabaena azotica]MBD2504575.1 hypothetical protein [Anabaena azotica FACHB-119]
MITSATAEQFQTIILLINQRDWNQEEKELIKGDPFFRERVQDFIQDPEITWTQANYQFAVQLEENLPLEILEDFIRQEFPSESNYVPPSEDDPIPF